MNTSAPAGPEADWHWLVDAPTYAALLEGRAAVSPDALFVVDDKGRSLTFGEFADQAARVAGALAAQGVGRGTRVAWQLPTRISTVLVMFALRRLGAVQAPIIPLYRGREVAVALETSGAEYFLVPGEWSGFDFVEMAGAIAESGPSPKVVEIGEDAPSADPVDGVASDPEEIAWIYFTSGSTGRPKGARHTDSSLLTCGRGFAGNGRLGEQPGEVAAMGFPLAHVGGIQYLTAAMSAGYPVLLLEAFVPDKAVAAMRDHRVTTTGGAPPFYQALVALQAAAGDQKILPDLRTLKGGGAPCAPELFTKVADVLDVVLAHDYGMTEVPMIGVADPRDSSDVLAATDGKLVPGNEVRVIGLDGDVQPDGAVGEIQVSGRGVCRGYTDQEETSAAFTHDGWFQTGDLGRVTDGHVEVVGRVKDVIIRKGENIVAQELEQLLTQLPSVAEVAVVGVPDADRGEMVCAVVVPSPGATPPSAGDLAAHLESVGVMRQKFPERVEILAELPRRGLAKVDKAALRSRLAPQGGQGARHAADEAAR